MFLSLVLEVNAPGQNVVKLLSVMPEVKDDSRWT
jgi:hypothetical protein